MAEPFSAKVKLAVDNSKAAHDAFQGDINKFVSQHTAPIRLEATDATVKEYIAQVQSKLSDHSFEIKIDKFDTSKAEKDLKKRLQNMIDSLSLENKVSITGLKDPTGGADGLMSQLQDAAEKAKGLENATAKANSQLKILKELEKNLTTSYNKVFKSGASGEDLDEITARYTELVEKINTARENKALGDFNDIQKEALAFQESINLLYKKVAAQKEVERAAKKVNEKNEDTLSLLKKQFTLHEQIRKAMSDNTRLKGKEEWSILESLFEKTKLGENGEILSSDDISKYTEVFKKLNLEIKDSNKGGKSFVDTVARAYEKFGGWALVTKSLGMVIRASKQVYHNVVDLDTAMTELKKVTDETNATYERFFGESISRAKELGATVSDVITATADYARLGYNLQDASALADASIIYKNVADGLTDINEASESIISTMQAFGIEASRAMEIVDRFNEVGNNFAISSAGIGEALKRSAAAMNSAGNTLDETIAMITAMNTTLQSPDSVGTVMKTLSMYLRAAKTEAEEAGESTDGMASSVSELREQLLSLTGGKVDIMIDEDTFKSSYQIMKELSAVWDEISDISQANILEMIAGKRNANAVSALIQNFDIAEDVIKTAANSTGSALVENEKYLDSIQGKIAEFQAAFEAFSAAILDSELIKFVIEGGTDILNILTAIGEQLGSFPMLIGSIVTAYEGYKAIRHKDDLFDLFFSLKDGKISKSDNIFGKALSDSDELLEKNLSKWVTNLVNKFFDIFSIFNKKWFPEDIPLPSGNIPNTPLLMSGPGLENTIKSLSGNEIIEANSSLQALSEMTSGLIETTPGVADGLGEAAEGIASMGKASMLTKIKLIAMNAAIAAGIALLATLAIKATFYLADLKKHQSERANEAAAKSKETSDQYVSEAKSIDDLIARYKELKEVESLSDQNRDEILNIQQELADLLSVQTSELDLVNGKLEDQVEILKEAATIQAERAQDAAAIAYDDAVYASRKAFSNYYKGDKDADAERILRASGYGTTVMESSGYTKISLDHIEGAENKLEALNAMMKALKEDADYDWGDSELFQTLRTEAAALEEYIKSQNNAADDLLNTTTNEVFKNSDDSVVKSIESYNEYRNSLIETAAANTDLKEAMENGDVEYEEIVDSIDELLSKNLPDWYRTVNVAAGTYVKTLSDLKTLVDTLNTSYDVMLKAESDIVADGSLSPETLKALIEIEDDYLKYLDFENEKLKLNKELWEQRSSESIKTSISNIESEIESLNNRNDELREGLLLDKGKYDSEDEWAQRVKALTKEIEQNNNKLRENQKLLIVYSQLLEDEFGSWQSTLSTFDAAFSSATTIGNIQADLADGLTIPLEKAGEYAKIYPELLNECKVAANGQIKLNATVVEEFIKLKEDEVDAALQAQITELEAKKGLTELELEEINAQLDALDGQVSDEHKATLARMKYRALLTAAFTEAGIEEETANDMVLYAMTGQWDKFSELAQEAVNTLDDESANSFNVIMQNFSIMATNMIDNVGLIIEELENLNNAMMGVDFTKETSVNVTYKHVEGSGKEAMEGMLAEMYKAASDEGGFNALWQKFLGKSGEFDISNYEELMDEASAAWDDVMSASKAQLEQRKLELEEEATRLQAQIDFLNAFKDADLFDMRDGGPGRDSSSSLNEYIVDIDRFKEALDRLGRARGAVQDLENEFSSLDDTDIEKRIAVQEQLIHAYKQEQDAIVNLNTLRREAIQESLDALKAAGFEVEYDSALDKFFVKNQEHINELVKSTPGAYDSVQEATNEYRKEMEKLIDTLDKWNEENKEEVANWLENQHKIHESKIQIIDDLKAMVAQASEATDAIQNVYQTLKDAADEYASNGGFISVDTFQSIMELGPEYLAYLKDENGQLVINEDRINKVIKAKKNQLALDTARSYLGRLEQAMQAGSIEQLKDLIRLTDEAVDSEWGLVYAQLAMIGLEGDLHKGALDTINAIRSLADATDESLNNANMSISDMNDGLNNLIDYVIDMLQHRLDEQIESLEDMKDAFSEIIDLRQEALDKAKEENDYQKDLTNKVKELAKLQDRINTLALDDSRSAQAEKARLEEEMAELQEELNSTQADKALEVQKESLDKMQEAYEKEKDKEIEILEESLDSYEEKYRNAINYIENNWDSLYSELIEWNTEFGQSLNSEITSEWEKAVEAVKKYGSVVAAVTKTNEALKDSGSGLSNNKVVGNTVYDSSYTNKDAVATIIKAMQDNGALYAGSNDARRKELSDANEDLAESLGAYGINAYKTNGTWYLDVNNTGKKNGASIGSDPLLYSSWKKYLESHHNGGIAGNSGSLKQNEVLSVLEDGEMILDDKKQKALYRFVDFATYFSEKFGRAITNLDLASLIPNVTPTHTFPETAPMGNINNNNASIHFGDVYISGASDETVAKHREVNREFANEVLKYLNIKR